jgi:hypothetical protein
MAIVSIPGVSSSLDSFAQGFGLTDNLMNQILARRHLSQQQKQFEQELALKKQQEARMGANMGLNRAILQQRLNILKQKSDPNYELNRFNLLFGGGQSGNQMGGAQPVNAAPAQTSQEYPALDEMFSGRGAFPIPEEMPRTDPVQERPAMGGAQVNNALLETLRNDPAKRALFKHMYKFDPLAPSQGEVLHGPARDAADLKKLKESEGENSEVYQNAKAAYEAQIDAKKDLRDLRARTKQGLKPGEKEFFDPETGVPLGKEIPLTAKERESEEGNILFNELYPHVYKGAAPFSGESSIRRLLEAAANYKTDPQAKKLFDDFLLAQKMLAATTVNEASTLKAGRTNRTYNMLKESLNAQDIPIKLEKIIKQYGIPPSAQLTAAMRYQKLLSDARNKARKGTPATQKLYYNPELQAQHEAQVYEGVPANTESKVVIVIDPDGKKFETTEDNAAHLPKGWKRG